MALNTREIPPTAALYARLVAGSIFGCWLLSASASVSTSSALPLLMRHTGTHSVVVPQIHGAHAVDDNARWLNTPEKGRPDHIRTVQAGHHPPEGMSPAYRQGQETG